MYGNCEESKGKIGRVSERALLSLCALSYLCLCVFAG